MRSTETFTETARRAQITDCAIEAIAELGYGRASVRKIADRAGVAMSVVLYHFGTKDELIAAVVSECYRTLLDAMLPAVGAETTAGARLAAHIRTHLRYLRTHRSHQIALTEIANGFRGRDGRRLWDLPVDPVHSAGLARVDLEVLLRAGVDSGEFRDLPVDSVATVIRGSIGAVLQRSIGDPAYDLDGYADDLIDLLARACAPTRTESGA